MWIQIFLISICVIFILILAIKRFVYFCPSFTLLTPKENFEDIREGNLHAWYKKGTSGKVILFCHGNAGNVSYRQDKLIELLKMGHSVLIFDYSGFGQSVGVPNEQLCYANGDTFVNYLIRKGYSKENIIPYGESLGASVASYLARKYNLPIVIIESGLPGIKYLVQNMSKFLYPLSLIFNEFDTQSYLTGYKGKILVLHAVNDEIIPYHLTQKIRQLATASGGHVIDMGGSHNYPVIPWESVKQFTTL